jgi:cutinase
MRASLFALFALPISVLSFPLAQNTNGNVTETTGISSNLGTSADGSSVTNSILAAIGNLPGIGTAITDISGALTTLEAGLTTLLGVQDNENGACAALTVIFARGTTEPGNVGVLAGPEFLTALQSMVGSSVTMQGVAYSASIEGFLEGGDPQGSQTM